MEELEEEEDYWELMIGRARKIRGVEDVRRYIRRIEEIVKIEIYDKDLMRETKRDMEKREEWRDGVNIVNIRKMREEDEKMYRKFVKRVVYYEEAYRDEYISMYPMNIGDWFTWFYNNKGEYMIRRRENASYEGKEEPKLYNIYLPEK